MIEIRPGQRLYIPGVRVVQPQPTGAAVTYLLRDLFTTNRAAGAVNGTAAEPGPGTRSLADASSVVSIASDHLVVAPNNTSPRLDYGIARSAGAVMSSRLVSNGSLQFYLGYDNASTGNSDRLSIRMASLMAAAYVNTVGYNFGIVVFTAGATYTVFVIPRTTGGFFLIQGESYPYPQLRMVDRDYSTALAFFAMNRAVVAGDYKIDNLSITDPATDKWYPAPIASDSFNRSNGAIGSTDGTGHAENATHPGGSGLAWTNQAGTFAISSNAVAASALSGGLAIATVAAGKSSVFVLANLIRSAGNVGVVLRYTDANNYIVAYYDGTNVKVDEVVGGVATNRISTAKLYQAGASIRVLVSARAIYVHYFNVTIGSYTALNPALTGTAFGIYTTDTGNTIDDFVVYAEGDAGEYQSALSAYGTLNTSYYADASEYDIFLVVGQSNARGRGDNAQTYSGSTARMFREDQRWAVLADPTNSDAADGSFGSPYPLLAAILESATGRKIAFITAAQGSTGLVNPANWPKGGTGRFEIARDNVFTSRAKNLKGILWYQGEEDAVNAVSQANYQTALSLLIDNFQGDLGLPAVKMTCALIGSSSASATNTNAIRAAQINRWTNDADILPGPPAHDQSFADGVHWSTDAQMLILAQRWARCILANYYSGSESARGPQFSSAAKSGSTVTVTFAGGQGDLQNQTSTTGWAVTDGNGARTVQSATGTSNTVTLTLDQALAGTVQVSFAAGNTGAGATLKDSGTYPLPPEPFVDQVAA